MNTVQLLLQVWTLGVVVYAARKAYWAAAIAGSHQTRIRQESVNATRQIEFLDGLYRKLGMSRGSLPPTRGWAASPDFLNILHDQIADGDVRTVVECGSGVSTVVAARALQQRGSGSVVSLDHDAHYAEQTSKLLRELELDDWAKVVVAPLKSTRIRGEDWLWFDLSGIELPHHIDLVVVDGPPVSLAGPQGRYPVGPRLFDRLSNRAQVLLDDGSRSGEKWIVDTLSADFPELRVVECGAEKGCVKLIASDRESVPSGRSPAGMG